MAGDIIKVLGSMFVLFALYQLVTHGTAVVAEFKAVGTFVVDESKVLEGR